MNSDSFVLVLWIFLSLSVVTTFVIAAVAVGSTTARLATQARRTVYDLDEAVAFVADGLPGDVTASISYDDVRAVLGWNLDLMQARGIASLRTAHDPGSGLIVMGDDEPLAWILGRIDDARPDGPGGQVTDEQVVAILTANRRYEQSIGVIGDQVSAPRLD